jgi:hypothetical protein
VNEQWGEEQIRRFVVEEVNRRVDPLHAGLEALNRWKLSLWSNGSGGPPGYLETARELDTRRYKYLFEKMEEGTKKMEEMSKAQETTAQFIALMKDRELQHQRRSVWYRWGLGIIIALLVSLAGWGYAQIEPAAKVIWEDYVRSHPQISRDISSASQPLEYAHTLKQQSDGGTITFGGKQP